VAHTAPPRMLYRTNVPQRIRLVPATSASSTRETEKKRPANTALPPWRSKRRSTHSRRSHNGPEYAENDGAPEIEVALLDQHSRSQEYGRTREGDPHGPQHHAEEDYQVAVVLDQGVEFVHSIRSIRTANAFEGLSEQPIEGALWERRGPLWSMR
jgi:hypothetical protein